MDFKHLFYPESRFGGFTDIDGTIIFYTRVNSLLEPHYVVVDFGCGRGAHRDDPVVIRRELKILKGKVQKVIGLDIDPVAEENPYIDEFYLLKGDVWPLQDDSVDLCISDAVLEHLERPESFFAECARVLRRGGICALEPRTRGTGFQFVEGLSRINGTLRYLRKFSFNERKPMFSQRSIGAIQY